MVSLKVKHPFHDKSVYFYLREGCGEDVGMLLITLGTSPPHAPFMPLNRIKTFDNVKTR